MSDEDLAVYRMVKREEALRFKRFLITFIVFTLLAVAGSLRAEDVRISTDPAYFALHRMGQENTVRVTVTIPRHPENTHFYLIWMAAYPGEGGSSYFQLDPKSPRQFTRTLRHVTAGYLRIWAELYRGDTLVSRTEKVIELVE